MQGPDRSFDALAAEYCALIESCPETSADDLLAALHRLLPALLAAATELPVTEPTNSEALEGPSHEAWMARYAALGDVLEDRVDYWTTSQVLPHSEAEAILLTLADDLADIWRDLATGLDHLTAGGNRNDVLWEWRFGFAAHWGTHAVEALRAVHALRTR